MTEFFRNMASFAGFYPQLSEIENYSQLKNANEHTQIFPDEIHDNVFFVRDGVLRSYYVKDDGTEFTEWVFAKGDIVFAPESLFYDKMPTISLQALCPSVLVRLKKSDYFYFRDKYPYFREITKSLEFELLKKQREHRENERLLTNNDRYMVFADKYPQIVRSIQGQQLARFFGVNPKTVTSMKKHYQRIGRS